jgi:membrane protein DedA with SNARE-associated domain
VLFFSILGALAGIAVGSRLRVVALAPAILLMSVANILANVANGNDARTTIFATLAAVATMQCGYIVGFLAAGYVGEPAKFLQRAWLTKRS